MIIVVSPAKTLDFESEYKVEISTQPEFVEESTKVMNKLSKQSKNKLKELMSISDNLAELNYERNQNWTKKHTTENAKPAVLAFKGDVYLGLEAEKFNKKEQKFAQKHLGLLSGLYGFLRPYDLLQPYRLEMGTSLGVGRKKNLYEFWKETVTNYINDLDGKYLINLASNEYFKVIDQKKITKTIITPVFKDYKNGQYKVISFFAKKARGALSSFMIQHQIKNIENLKGFDWEGYLFNKDLSKDNEWVFSRNLE